MKSCTVMGVVIGAVAVMAWSGVAGSVVSCSYVSESGSEEAVLYPVELKVAL